MPRKARVKADQVAKKPGTRLDQMQILTDSEEAAHKEAEKLLIEQRNNSEITDELQKKKIEDTLKVIRKVLNVSQKNKALIASLQNQEVIDDTPKKIVGKSNQRNNKRSLSVVPAQAQASSPSIITELEETPEYGILDKEECLEIHPQPNILPVPDQKNPPPSVAPPISPKKQWIETVKPKHSEQYFPILVQFCRTHLQLKEVEGKFQEDMRNFLNNEVEELKNNPIPPGTAINFSILGAADGKSTSAFFNWIQDRIPCTKTIGLANYLNRTGITGIPR